MSARFDEMVNEMVAMRIPREKAEAAARADLGISSAAAQLPSVDEGALEKTIELEGDRLMQKLGFEVIKFSHPGKTKQTEGIADRRYYHRRRCLALWWEAKSATGAQRPGQRVFQELVEACGETYVLGTHEALINWLIEQRVAVPVGDSLEPLIGAPDVG